MLYANTGGGTFVEVPGRCPFFQEYSTSIALGDVDGDGDLDAVIGNGPVSAGGVGQLTRLLLNDGRATFRDGSAQLPAHLDSCMAVALGDVDGDLDLDLVKGNHPEFGFFGQATPQDRLYRNDGRGNFTDATADLPVETASARAIELVDVDLDGDLDVAVGNGALPLGVGNTELDAIYWNEGGGRFASASTSLSAVPGHSSAIAARDFDLDGDVGVFSGRVFESDRLYTNVAVQLAWRSIPRVGKRLHVDVRGPSGGAWVRWVAVGQAEIPLPPFGTLRLDPAVAFFVGSGVLDVDGRATMSTFVPADPWLVGFTLYSQALVGPPIRFTNLDVETFTAL